MATLKLQKLVYESEDSFLCKSGSASLVGNVYDPSKKSGHTAHPVIEKLGKVVWYDKENKVGIFYSDTRGLVEYDANEDVFTPVEVDDGRIAGAKINPGIITHTDYGDVFMCISILNQTGLTEVLRQAFPDDKDYKKVLSHVIHGICSNSSRIKCGEFVRDSALSYVVNDIAFGILDCDSTFYELMGSHEAKLAFFKNYIAHLRKENPDFGKACYVDSTPLPNEIRNNPFNAFSNHGTVGSANQTRLVLVLDQANGKPVWFDFINGNTLDFQTVGNVCEELDIQLAIDIQSMIVDAGYACQELFDRYNIENYEMADKETGEVFHRLMVARMPDKNGYPYGDLYQEVKDDLHNARYQFIRNQHTYFGRRFERNDILGHHEYVYTYLDQEAALTLNRKYREQDPKGWEALSEEEQNWLAVKDGYFNLISNKKDTPEAILDEYFGRTDIECFIKNPKSYLKALPLGKWNKARVKGKVLTDIISTILYLDIRNKCAPLQLPMSSLLISLGSVECTLNQKTNTLLISTMNKQVRECFNTMGIHVEAHMDLDIFKKMVMEQYKADRPSLQIKKQPGRKAKPVKIPKSKEQKAKESEEKKAAKKAKQQKEKEASKANKEKEKKARQTEKELAKAQKEIQKLKASIAS